MTTEERELIEVGDRLVGIIQGFIRGERTPQLVDDANVQSQKWDQTKTQIAARSEPDYLEEFGSYGGSD